MENLYSEELYSDLKKEKNKILIISSIIFGVAIILVGLTWFIIKPSNYLLIKILVSIFLSIIACGFFYCLLEIVLPRNHYAKFVYHLLTTNRYKDSFYIISIGRRTIVEKDIYCYELEAIDSNKSKIYLCIEEQFLSKIKEDEKIEMIISQNIVIALEDKKNG